MPSSFKVARSIGDKNRVYKFRYRVFVEEEHRFDYPKEEIQDVYDALAETVCIIAEHNNKVVGTIRATVENPVGLPPLDYYDFKPFMSRHVGKFAGIGWLCITSKFRVHRGMLPGLFKTIVREVKKKGVRHLIAALHPGVLPVLKYFGAEQVDAVFHSKELDVPMVPIHIDLENLPIGVHENFQDPLNLFFDDSNERRTYTLGECLTKTGESGKEAFLIMRGSVQVLFNASGIDRQNMPESPLLGPGQIFGELALLDGGPRTATVVCHSREVDVMIYTQDEFLRQLRKNHSRAYEICRILGSRFRYLLEAKKGDPKPQEILIARILVDASRKGERPVEVNFLASQCGLWKKEMRPLLLDWQQKKLINFKNRCLVQIADLQRIKKYIVG